jgi:DNA ligase 4
MKEAMLAKTYIEALGLAKESEDGRKLAQWKRPDAGSSVGNFSDVVASVLAPRCQQSAHLNITEVNNILDELNKADDKYERVGLKIKLTAGLAWNSYGG